MVVEASGHVVVVVVECIVVNTTVNHVTVEDKQ